MKRLHSALWVLVGASALGQTPKPEDVQIKTTKVAAGVYMLEGQGGNIGVSVGDDGVILVDTEFAPLTPKIQAAVAALSPKPIRFVINTHFHGDHVGGNENFAAAGAIILAHDNVRKRMSVDQFMEAFQKKIPAAPAKALPIVTFAEDVTLHLNGETIHAFHVGPAHTDGDVVVHFEKANVVHTGDAFVSGYPLVDWSSGGRFDGFIDVVDKLLGLGDDKTQLIPGHGPLSDRTLLKAWKEMLTGLRDRVKAEVAAGKTLDQIKAAKPSAPWDKRYAGSFMTPDRIVEMVCRGVTPPLSGAKPAK